MKNANDKERFIELRAEGRSYADIADALKVSKPTLIAWGKELERDIKNARNLRLDELFQKYAVSKEKRIKAFGERLDAILAELDKRNLADVPTSSLLTLALKYGEAMKQEWEPLTMQGEDREAWTSPMGMMSDKWEI